MTYDDKPSVVSFVASVEKATNDDDDGNHDDDGEGWNSGSSDATR